MITEEDIKNILLLDAKNDPVLGLIPEIVKDEHAPVVKDKVKERIVIVLPGGTDNGQLSRSFPRMCIYVPCIKEGDMYLTNGIRQKALQQHCISKYRSSVYVEHEGNVCLYAIDTITTEHDPETWSNIINVRFRFETVNTKL